MLKHFQTNMQMYANISFKRLEWSLMGKSVVLINTVLVLLHGTWHMYIWPAYEGLLLFKSCFLNSKSSLLKSRFFLIGWWKIAFIIRIAREQRSAEYQWDLFSLHPSLQKFHLGFDLIMLSSKCEIRVQCNRRTFDCQIKRFQRGITFQPEQYRSNLR